MKRFFINIIVIATLLAVADLMVGVVAKRVIANLPDSAILEADIVQSLNKKKADILILGSSKAKHSFVPRLFSDSLHLTAYNAGCDGHDVIYASLVLESFLERCQPKIVVLGLWNSMLDGSWHANSINNCKSLYKANRPYTEWVNSHEPLSTRIKMQSNIYRLNSSMVWMLKSYAKGDQHSDGYAPLYEVPKKMSDTMISGFKPDSVEEATLKRIINLCHRKGIKLYIALAPDHEIDNGMRKWVADFCKINRLWFHDYTFEKSIQPEITNFSDAGHLSDKGAHAFTRIFISHMHHRSSVSPSTHFR